MGVIGKIEDKWDQTRQIKIKQDPQRPCETNGEYARP